MTAFPNRQPLPQFRNFREACECLHAGGKIYRFGVGSVFYNHGGITWRGRDYYAVRNSGFSLEEQTAGDWVLISPEERAAQDERARKMYEEISERNHLQSVEAEKRKRESSIMGRLRSLFGGIVK